MYNINDLYAMQEGELRKLASDMGMKKSDSSDVDSVIYHILDHQASETAKEQARNAQERKKTTKKKSEPKEETPAAKEETPKEEAPKKRTRKAKTETATEEEKPKAKTTKKRKTAKEETPVEETTTPEAEAQPKKKRGRPSKKEAEAKKETETGETPAETPAAEQSQLALPLVEEKKEVVTAQEEKPKEETPEAPKALPQPLADNAFGSFFSKGKGKTFTPRGAQASEPDVAPQQQFEGKRKQHKQNRQNQEVQEPVQPQMPMAPVEFHPVANENPIEIHEPAEAKKQNPNQNAQKLTKRQKQQLRMQKQMEKNAMRQQMESYNFEGLLSTTGLLEIMPEGHGFLRSCDYNYMPSPDDIFVPSQLIKQVGLKTGDVVEASVLPPAEGEKYYPIGTIYSVNGLNPEIVRDRVPFEHLTPLFPDSKFNLTGGKTCNISTRVVDMFAPIGKGQRALIVAPPKTGKTILLKDIANAIAENHPDTYIIMLLIDERPEEVTDMARSVNAEVIASTFDEPADRHVKIAGLVLEKAKRLVESGHDVVIMLDSITRLARAYNTVSPASGKILSGGVDANALQRPKRFFGAARNIENGGSLTIIATALTETSSKMDEVIFEEFKGTGNMELQLDRKLSNKRIFPAVDIVASSTRRDDLLLPKEILSRMWVLRNYLGDMNSLEAMEFMKKRMEMTRTNEELLITMDK